MRAFSKEANNILIWDGQTQGFYEVYFLKWNDLKNKTAAWIRYTLTSPLPSVGDPYCELWGIFFDVEQPENNFAVKNRFPISKLHFEKDRHHVKIAEAELLQNSCHANLVDPATGNEMAWNLTFDSDTPTNHYFPSDLYYKGGFPKTKGLSPHLDARFSGTLEANGRTFKIENAPGQQTHLWGSNHAHRWAWGHCNTFVEDETAIWEGLDAQIKLGPMVSPHFKIFYLKVDGEEHFFNTPSYWIANKGNWELGKWNFEFQNEKLRAVGEIGCNYNEMVGVTYMDPNGANLWCNNSKVATLKITLYTPQGEKIRELTSDHGSALEFVDRKTYPQVPIRI